jgi:capsular polysaccharide biosynthesis protein
VKSFGSSLLVALVVGAVVLAFGATRPDEFQGRVSVLAEPAAGAESGGTNAQYGEVVSLALPALVELSRSPSVLEAAAPVSGYTAVELGKHVSVELVPASGLARLSVRAGSADQAGAAASAIAKAMVDSGLLAPVGRLRVLDERPDIVQVAPDRLLALGLALAAAAVAGVAAAVIRQLRTSRGHEGVRKALVSAGANHPVLTIQADDPTLDDRLAVLVRASGRPARVVAVTPDLVAQAGELEVRLPEGDDKEGDAVIALTRRGDENDLAAAVGVLPATALLVAVVVA